MILLHTLHIVGVIVFNILTLSYSLFPYHYRDIFWSYRNDRFCRKLHKFKI